MASMGYLLWCLIVISVYCGVMKWIYRKFIKPRIQSKVKRFFIIIGMIALYFIQPMITNIYAYYKFVYSMPTLEPDSQAVANVKDINYACREHYGDEEKVLRDGVF